MPPQMQCEVCGITFRKRLPAKNYKYRFCSTKCSGIHNSQTKNVTLNCDQCGCEITKWQSQVRKHNFCGHPCAATYTNTHKTKGTRVSKLELFLQKELRGLYPSIKFLFNDKSAINSELDIYLPDFSLAFELNGIFHYEPIYGADKLSQIQNNDTRKFQACLEQGIELVIIDTSSMNYFKEAGARKYLGIITALINNKVVGRST